jgi:threonyl-tRNA synthetase
VQATILPIADRHLGYAREVQRQLSEAGLRVELDERQEKIGYKIRGAQLHKVPYMLVIGDREVTESAVAVRHRTDGDLGSQTVDAFIQTAAAEVRARHREAANPQRGAA